ncbi:uncharacterized protein LOC115210255 isoform X6 [Octopus sinensis]|uniref:Uncharacterized protein LOC115210255 isoform X6 n=1 Tax=Octopus sinensis TaxID=2607531 RepID=A0A7E6ERG5_9MOLL|nr:uncharacterized protein LOC115210255 isoform X6 [Octopus sinensis]
MDSTKIINNQPADGFHNSTVYRKCDGVSGEGSGEIILSSDYGGVSAGNRVEMKKSSSPCKIPVQQKQKTNMSTGTKHSVKSSQLPRGKSTLIDQTTRISLNKQTTQQTSADSSRLPSKCTGKKSSLVNGDTNVKKQGDKNTSNLKNINVGKSVSSSKIHRNTALSKTKHQTTSDISSKNCNELISVDKHISAVLSEELPEDSESAIDEVKVVNELNDKFRLRSDSESSHASHSSFCSQLSTSSVKSSICLPSSTKGGLGKTSKILTSSCSRLAVSKAETKLQKKPSMLSRTTSSTTVSRTSNSALSHPSKSSPAHSRLTSRVNTENLQRAVSTGSLRNNSNKSSIPPTGRSNTTATKSSGLSLRQKKVADSASDLSVNSTTRLGSRIQNKESLKTVSSENLSNKIQNSFGKSCENLAKKKKNVLQASCENLSVKSRNNSVTTSDSTLQQKGISHNKKLTPTQSISNGGLVHQKEKYSGGMSLLKASRISGSSSSSIPTAATAADKLDNKKLSNVRPTTSAVTERRTGVGLGSNQEGKPTTNIDRSQIKKSIPATGKKTTSLKSNEAIEPLSKKKLVAKTSRGFSDHKVTSNLPTASSKASSGIKKSKLLEAQSHNVVSQTAGKNFQGKATYDSNRLQLDKTRNTLSVNEVENSELHYKELDDAPENEDKVDKDSSSTKPNISENFAYDDYMIITEALSDESISGPSVHVGDLDNVSNPNHLSDVDASESYQTSSSASALDISLHEDYVYNGSLVTSSSDNYTDKHTGFQCTQSAVHACREVTSSYQTNTSEDECSEKEEKEEMERKEDTEENRVKLKLSDHGVIKSDAYSDKTFDYEASYDCNLSSCGYQQPQKHYGQPCPHQQYPHHPPQHHYHPPHQSTGTENSFKNLSTDDGRGAQSSPQLHSINDSKCVYSFEFEEGQNQKQAEEDGEEKAVGESENLEEKASVVVFKSADIYRVAGHGMPVVEFTPPQIAHHNISRNENSGSGGCNPVSATDRTSKDVTATKTTTVLRGDDTEGELAGAERSDEEAVDCPVNKLLQRERDRPTSFTQVNVGEEARFKQQISFGEVAVTTTTTILAATIKADVTNSSLQEMADQPGIQSSKLQLGDLHTSQTRTQTYDRDVMCEKGDLSRSTATLFMEQQQQQLNSNATRQMTGPFLPSEMGFLAGQMLSPCSNDSSSFKDISDGAVTPLSDVQEIFDQETSQLNDISNVDELSGTCKHVSDIAEGETEGVLIEIEDSTLQVSGSPDGEDEIIVEEQDYVVTDERNYNEESTHFTNDDIIGERPIVDAGEDLAEVTLDSNETQNLWFSIEAETDSQYENLSTSITLENIAESSIGEDVEELLDQSPSIESSNTSSRIHGNLHESILRQLQTQISEDDAPDILSEEISPSLEHLQLRTKSEETDFGKSDQQLISGCNEKRINKDSYLHSHQLEPCFHTDSLAENIQQRPADVKLGNFKSQTKNCLSGNTVLDDKNLLETNFNFNEDVQRAYTNSLKYGYKNEFDSLDVNICNNDISQEMEIEDGGFVILKNEGVKKTNDNSNQDFTLRQLQGTLNLRKQKILELCGQTESVSSKDIKSPSPTKVSIDRKERSPSFKRLDAFCTIPGSINENISPTKTNSSLALNIPKADTLQNLSPKTDEIVSPIKESWIKHEGKWRRGYILDDGSSIPSEKYQDYILKSTPVTPNSDGEHSFIEKYSSAQIMKSDSFEENSLTLKQEQSSNFEEISKCTMELFNQSPVLEEEVFGNNEEEFTHENLKMHKTVLGDITSSKESYDSVDGQPSEINILSLDTNSKIKDYGKTEITEAEMTHKSQAELTLQTETVQPVITEQKTYSPEIVDDIPFVDMDETVCDSNIVSIASVKLKNSASQDLPEVTPMQDTLSSVNTKFKSKEMESILDLQENSMEQLPHPSVIESTSISEYETAVDLDTITDDPSTHSSVDELKCEPLIDSGFEHPLHEFDNVSMAVSDIVTTNDTDSGRLIDSGIAQPSDMDWVPITDEYDILPANAEECVPYLNCEPVNANKRMQHDSDDALPIHSKEVVNEIDSPRKLIDSQSLPMDIPQGKSPGLSTDMERNKIKNKHTEKQEMNFANSSDAYHASEETESSLGNQKDMPMLEQDIYGSSPREVGSLCDEIFSIIGSPTLLNESWKKLSQNKSESDLSKSENELYFDGKRTYRNLPTSRSVYANIIRSSIYENSESESSESLDSITKISYDDLKQTKDKNNIKLKGQGYSSNEDSPEGLMSSMDFYLDASEFARACWSDRSTLSEFYQVGSHQKLRASDSSTYGVSPDISFCNKLLKDLCPLIKPDLKGIYAVKGEDSQDIKLLAEISELDETCGENNHILSQTERSENIQHNDNSLSRSETYWSPGSSPSMRKPYRRSLSLPFANHDGEDGRSILHCSKVDLEYPVTTAGFGSPPELPSKIGRSLRKHNTVYQWKIGKEKERRDGYDFKVVDVTLGNEQMISENSHEVIHRKHSVSSRERPKSDINVHWPQHVKQVASYFDPRHLREHRESTISRPRPKSDLGGSTLSSEAMKEFLQGKLPQSQSQKTISEMNRTSYLVTKARRVLDDKMSTPHPIKSRIADRSALTKQKKILGRSHSMPENLNKIHKRRRIHPSGSDPLSDLLSQHSTNDDSSDESEVSMDYSLPDKCHSTRTSQLGLAPLDEIFETENLTYAEALWDHVTMDPDELAFRAGEVIKVTDMIDKDWWWGILEDKDGWFPANFVRLRANQDHHLEEAAKLEGADSSKDSSSNVGKTHQFNSNQARTNVINEIISAEREYVHQLDDVLQGYVVQAKKRPDMFPDDKISTIFGNLEDIYTFSKKFFKSLEVSLKDDLHQSEVGHCFIEHRKGFEIYSDYCNNHPHACDQLKELCKNKRYRHFFEGCRLLQDMKQIPLEGFLLTPVQKICKYPLQLAELLKYTSTSHPDYHDVCEALDAMKKIACLINERKRRMESIEKIAEWQATVEDWEGPDLLETSSELIYSGELSKVNSSGWTQERYFFLFDHQLIYCRKDLLKKNSFSFRGRIYLDHSKIYPVVDGRDPQFNVYVKNGWKLHDNKRNKSFLVFSKNAVEKDRWLKAFEEERKKVKSDQENGFTIPPSLRKSCARNSFRTKTQPERPKEKLMKKNMPMSFRHQQELWKNLPAHATLPRGMTNPTLFERVPHTSANKKRSWFPFPGKKKR